MLSEEQEESNRLSSKEAEILTMLISEQWSQARQSEEQRATITNIVIGLFTLAQGFIVQQSFSWGAALIAVVIILLGIYGYVACSKLYERFRLATNRVGEMMKDLDQIYPNARIRELQKQADVEHFERFSRLKDIRLHLIWTVLHLSIAAFGLVNLAIIIAVN